MSTVTYGTALLVAGDDAKHPCVVCGGPSVRLIYGPDGWMCRPCSDRLGQQVIDEKNTKA